MKMEEKTAGRAVKLVRMINRPTQMYSTLMMGVSHSHTSPMRLMPPRMTTAVKRSSTMPLMMGGIPHCSSTPRQMELVSTMAPQTM